ncbi:glycoside hydrolase family 19 protein [Pseudosporangium ferrugineum]|uniref:Putative chitinase n=1 Tax=Pseudosporangium ferrugineum TaxID=439699 RepID=A0A2T0S841_9ACTN|nr:glycoside hydrolase family 19 protein [Pseudosporangium ferrugineum]PRY29592.1 putative chitinase [Pseudosporangium ferrugineum]
MAAGKLRKAAQAHDATKSILQPNATNIFLAIVSLIGFWPVVALAMILLIVIIAITGNAASSPNPFSSSGSDYMSTTVGGDGKGTLAEDKIPDKNLVKPLKDAAKECDLLSPAILAAQIEVESGFRADKEGPDGKKGISQVPAKAFEKFGKDDDNNGKVSALDAEDSIFAQARYLCSLAKEVQQLLDDKKAIGDKLTLTLLAWEKGIDYVKEAGGAGQFDLSGYPFRVRSMFANYLSGESAGPSSAASSGSSAPDLEDPLAAAGSARLSAKQFDELFPARDPLYTYAGLQAAMAKFPAFAGTGDDTVRKREIAAFLANLDHESGGFKYTEEVNTANWGNYCDAAQPYGCPAGQTAYHGRGPIQLSWNNNYKAAGDAIGVDLLNEPDKVSTESAVAWQTAMWFWMTQSGAGPMPAHAAITGTAGFGGTIRSINGSLECNGGNPAQVENRIASYRAITKKLGVEPGDNISC